MKFIIHVGMGKTGSTSIQSYFEENYEANLCKDIQYTGIMLENFDVPEFGWQAKSQAPLVNKILHQSASQSEFVSVLNKGLLKAKKNQVKTVVWSNEGLFGCLPVLMGVVAQIELDGIELLFIAYLRNPIKWSLSAYKQWGIKHKTYEGPIVSFKDYFSKRELQFTNKIKPLLKSSFKVVLRNFDECGDVLTDFNGIIGLNYVTASKKKSTQQHNLTPDDVELFFRAIFNNRREQRTLPDVFNKELTSEAVNFDWQPLEWYEQLLPSQKDIADLLESSKEEISQLNTLLKENEQPIFNYDLGNEIEIKNSLTLEKIVGGMVQILLNQKEKLTQLEIKLKQMEQNSSTK